MTSVCVIINIKQQENNIITYRANKNNTIRSEIVCLTDEKDRPLYPI